ncbi:DUF4113 domain-containing protein [Comamonas endophytica]|uniref:DUF4113 domain-containing protein n=1 Tax=Comamonas endophytica TaxID=2949090 RepID=UPI003613E3B5
MEVMDRINGRWAKLRYMSPAQGMPKVEFGWRMRQALQTPRYTTALDSCRLRMPTCEGSEGVIVKRIHSNIYTYIYLYIRIYIPTTIVLLALPVVVYSSVLSYNDASLKVACVWGSKIPGRLPRPSCVNPPLGHAPREVVASAVVLLHMI